MTREEKIQVNVDKIHNLQTKLKSYETAILKCFKFRGFEEIGQELPFVQEHEDGSVNLVNDDGVELELSDACFCMDEHGCIFPEDF